MWLHNAQLYSLFFTFFYTVILYKQLNLMNTHIWTISVFFIWFVQPVIHNKQFPVIFNHFGWFEELWVSFFVFSLYFKYIKLHWIEITVENEPKLPILFGIENFVSHWGATCLSNELKKPWLCSRIFYRSNFSISLTIFLFSILTFHICLIFTTKYLTTPLNIEMSTFEPKMRMFTFILSNLILLQFGMHQRN